MKRRLKESMKLIEKYNKDEKKKDIMLAENYY